MRNSRWSLILILSLGLALVSSDLWAESAQERFDAGNLAYQKGKYREALRHYRKLEEWNVEHPALYFNTSNAYFQLKHYGYALLYIERALKLRPHAEDYLANRRLIRAKLAERSEKLKRRFRLVYGQDAGFLASLISGVPSKIVVPSFLLAYVLFFLLLALAVARPSEKKRWVLRIAVGLSLLTTLGFGGVYLGRRYLEHSRRYGIIVTAHADVYPNSMSRDRAYELYEGAKVQIVDTAHPKRIKVRLSEDSEGWVDRANLKGI